MYRPFLILLSLSTFLVPTDQCTAQKGAGSGIEQKIQNALENILDDELQGEFEDVLNRLARRVEDEMSTLLNDEQIKGLAEAIEKGDVESRLQGPIAETGFSRLT